MICATLDAVMASLRRLWCLAGVALVCQLSAQVLLPAVTIAIAPAAEECTCPHGDGQVCPMHHRSTSAKTCAWRSTVPDPAAAALLSFLGPLFVTIAATDVT